MNVYKKNTMKDLVKDNSYVGRGIVIGKTEDGTKAAVAYFIRGAAITAVTVSSRRRARML